MHAKKETYKDPMQRLQLWQIYLSVQASIFYGIAIAVSFFFPEGHLRFLFLLSCQPLFFWVTFPELQRLKVRSDMGLATTLKSAYKHGRFYIAIQLLYAVCLLREMPWPHSR